MSNSFAFLGIRSLVPFVGLALTGAAIVVGCSSGGDDRKPIGGSGGNSSTGGMGGMGGLGGSASDPCVDVECPLGAKCIADGDSAGCFCTDETCTGAPFCTPTSCDPNATCSERPGGFACSCNSGYFGNGFTCGVDELCADVACDGKNERCLSDGVTAVCVCRTGFEISGGECSDVDECANAPCGANAECLNYSGGYSCDCDAGYAPNETGGCSKVDLCSGATNVCDDRGMTCVDVGNSVSCECSPSEVPGPTFCKASASCTGSSCKNGGDCVELETGFACVCPSGTTGPTCNDTASCSLATVLNAAADPIIEDPTLRRVLENAAGVFDGSPITVGDLQFFTDLSIQRNVGEPAVTTLAGLECLPSLRSVVLGDNDITSLAPLANMNALQILDLSCNPITSIASLSGKLSIIELRMSQNEACTGSVGKLASPSSLASLENLRRLDLNGQGISVDPGLSGLPYLKDLVINNNPIDALAGLATIPSLESLKAASTSTASFSGLSKFPSLRSLDVSDTAITSLTGIASASELRGLTIDSLGLSSLSGISGAAKLRTLSANDNALTSGLGIAGSSSLYQVSLANNSISALTDLANASSSKFQGTLQVQGNALNCSTFAEDRVALEDKGIFVISDCN